MSADPQAGPEARRESVLVDIPAGAASAAELLGAVDAALGGDLGDVRVRVLIGPDHPARPSLAALCDSDPRVLLVGPDAAAEAPAALRVIAPPAARPAGHTLSALREILADGEAAAVEVAVPGIARPLGRLAVAARLPGATRLRAERPGADGPVLRVAARRVGLGGTRAPFSGPPPQRDLAGERAEHLRQRARSATLRARWERDGQRLTRETMRAEHERARALLLERRIAATSVPRRIASAGRSAARAAATAARRAWWWGVAARALAAKGWRFARGRLRARRSGPPPA